MTNSPPLTILPMTNSSNTSTSDLPGLLNILRDYQARLANRAPAHIAVVNDAITKIVLNQRKERRGEETESIEAVRSLAQNAIRMAQRDLGELPPAPELIIPPVWGKSLLERGLDRAASIMRWRDGRDGWEYPVYDDSSQVIAVRWKAYDSHRTPKYLWLKGKAEWYYLPGIAKAVERAHGLLIIANGEPGVLTFIAAAMYNTAAFYGEGNVPTDFMARLKAWGVRRVLYFPDLDQEKIEPDGRITEPKSLKAARKLRDMLAPAGIDFDPRALPDVLPEKGDTNDLWQCCQFNRDTFRQTLDALPPFIVTDATDTMNEKFRPNWTDQKKKTDSSIPPAFVQAVEVALGVTGHMNQEGWYRKKVKCPFHSDEHPSATWNGIDPRLRCHSGCGRTYSIFQVAKIKNINIDNYR